LGRSVSRLAFLPLIVLLVQPSPARALDDVVSLGDFSLDVNGFLEGRAIMSGKTRS